MSPSALHEMPPPDHNSRINLSTIVLISLLFLCFFPDLFHIAWVAPFRLLAFVLPQTFYFNYETGKSTDRPYSSRAGPATSQAQATVTPVVGGLGQVAPRPSCRWARRSRQRHRSHRVPPRLRLRHLPGSHLRRHQRRSTTTTMTYISHNVCPNARAPSPGSSTPAIPPQVRPRPLTVGNLPLASPRPCLIPPLRLPMAPTCRRARIHPKRLRARLITGTITTVPPQTRSASWAPPIPLHSSNQRHVRRPSIH